MIKETEIEAINIIIEIIEDNLSKYSLSLNLRSFIFKMHERKRGGY